VATEQFHAFFRTWTGVYILNWKRHIIPGVWFASTNARCYTNRTASKVPTLHTTPAPVNMETATLRVKPIAQGSSNSTPTPDTDTLFIDNKAPTSLFPCQWQLFSMRKDISGLFICNSQIVFRSHCEFTVEFILFFCLGTLQFEALEYLHGEAPSSPVWQLSSNTAWIANLWQSLRSR
jgi:hypothetical protein